MYYTILFVYPSVFNPQLGGIERVTDLLARAFIRKGHNVLYLHLRRIHDADCLDYRYPAPVFFFPEENIDSETNRNFYHKFLQEYHIDFIINQCGNFNDSRLFLDIPIDSEIKTISVLHGEPLLNYRYLSKEILCLKNNSKKEYLKLLLRAIFFIKIKRNYRQARVEHFKFLFNHTDCVCLLSHSHVDSFFNTVYNGNLKSKIYVIPNPCSFSPLESLPRKKKQLLYVGRLDKGSKRPDRLLKVWSHLYKKYPDWNLVIVGDGKQRAILEKRARNMERVSFIGYADPRQYYIESSIFCMTSNFEGLPMVLLEAMCFGTIPVAFNSFASVTDVITDKRNGLLVPPFSVKGYVEKIEYLINNESIRSNMAKAGIESVRRYTIDSIIEQWETLFAKLKVRSHDL